MDNLSFAPVSIVIVNYNAGDLLTECVRISLKQAQQVIVVDNASTDTSMTKLVTSFPLEKRLCIWHADSNLGFAAGCNIGLDMAAMPYILFLNPDCMLASDTLVRLIQVIETNPHIGMVGGRLINPDGSEQGGGRRAIPTPWRAFVRAFGLYRLEKFWPRLFFDFHLHKQPLPCEPIEVEAISGAIMLVRREAIKAVDAWDENYFLHCEDLDWCVRFRQQGWKILFVPDAPVLHYRGTCSLARPIFVAWYKHKGMLRFYQKFFYNHYPKPLMWLVTSGVWLRFGVVVTFYTFHKIYKSLGFKHE